MQDTILNSGWDTVLVAAPFLGLLVIAVFRLDEAFAAPKAGRPPRRPAGMDENGDPILSDPDGRPWRKPGLA